jgi:hypothetical protein
MIIVILLVAVGCWLSTKMNYMWCKGVAVLSSHWMNLRHFPELLMLQSGQFMASHHSTDRVLCHLVHSNILLTALQSPHFDVVHLQVWVATWPALPPVFLVPPELKHSLWADIWL